MKKAIQIISKVAIALLFFTHCTPETHNGIAEVNSTRLYYEITGKGTPLIFLHGFTCDHRNWNPQVEYFAKRYKVITYDLRGHGQSSVPDTIPYSYVEDLEALIDYLSIEKAVVIGHSLGGGPAFFYAKDHPKRVLALVLAEGGAILSDPAIVDTSLLTDYFKEFSRVREVVRKHGLQEGKKALMKIHPMKDASENPISSELFQSMLADYSGWHWLNNNPQKRNPHGTVEMMGSIEAPTLIVSGEYSHPVFKDLVRAQSLYIPNSKKVIIAKSNHMLNIENPDQFNQELETFLLENEIH